MSSRGGDPAARLAAAKRLLDFLRQERAGAYARIGAAQDVLLACEQRGLELGPSTADTLDCIRRNAEQDLSGVVPLLSEWTERVKAMEERAGAPETRREVARNESASLAEDCVAVGASGDAGDSLAREESLDDDVGLGMKIDGGDSAASLRRPPGRGESSGDDIDSFDPFTNEDDARFGVVEADDAGVSAGKKRSGSLMTAAEAENEEERREEEDVVPDNLSRLPTGVASNAVVSGRFTTTPAVRMGRGEDGNGRDVTTGENSSAAGGMARSLPVSVPVLEAKPTVFDALPPVVDKEEEVGTDDIPTNIEMIAKSLHIGIHGELPSPPKKQQQYK